MDNIVGAIFGIVLLLVGIALFPIGFALEAAVGGLLGEALLAAAFIAGVVLLSAALPLPVFLLDRFEGVRDTPR